MVRLRYGTVRSDHTYGKIWYGYGTVQRLINLPTFRAKGNFWSFFQNTNVVTYISPMFNQDAFSKKLWPGIEPRTFFRPAKRYCPVNYTFWTVFSLRPYNTVWTVPYRNRTVSVHTVQTWKYGILAHHWLLVLRNKKLLKKWTRVLNLPDIWLHSQLLSIFALTCSTEAHCNTNRVGLDRTWDFHTLHDRILRRISVYMYI
jgi:hypothetical protein